MTAQVAADLRAAADVLERDGWTQGTYHEWRGETPCHCVQGALAVAVSGRPLAEPGDARDEDFPCSRWDRANMALVGVVGYNTADWNDSHRRTADEVIATLRAAADAAEAEQ